MGSTIHSTSALGSPGLFDRLFADAAGFGVVIEEYLVMRALAIPYPRQV